MKDEQREEALIENLRTDMAQHKAWTISRTTSTWSITELVD